MVSLVVLYDFLLIEPVGISDRFVTKATVR